MAVAMVAGAWASGCAGDEEDPLPPSGEAGVDAPLVGDATSPDAGAEVPLGEPCGDRGGLEPEAPWPMRGGCPKRAGTGTGAGAQNATVKWSLAIPAGDSSPAVSGDRLVWFGSVAGDVMLVSSGGVVQGALATGGAVRSSPVRAATGWTVVVGGDGALYGVARGASAGDAGAGDAGDGGVGADAGWPAATLGFRRTGVLASTASAPAIGGDGTVYVGSADGKLVALSVDGSAVVWSQPVGDLQGSSPAVASDGTIYVGSADGKLHAIARDGVPRWTFDAGAGASVGSPVVGGDETVYVGAADGKLHAIAPDGKARWSYATGGAIRGAPAVRGGTVYVGSEDKKLHAVATPSGEGKWTYATLGVVATPVVDADGRIYVGSGDGKVYAISGSGLLAFAVNVKGAVRSAPAIGDDGTVYVTSEAGIFAIGP